MKPINVNVILLLVVSLVISCHRDIVSHYIRPYGKAELNRLIRPGMSEADITNIFGPAGSEMPGMENEHVIITYLYSPKATRQEKGPHLVGFNVDFKNGRVTEWLGVTSESFNSIPPSTSYAETSLGNETFELFIAGSELANILKTFDSIGVVDASDLKASPNLVFKAQVFAINDASSSSTNRILFLIINGQDVPKLKKITEDNIGKRLLIVCHRKVIAAPVILVPLTSNKFQFPIKDPDLLNKL